MSMCRIFSYVVGGECLLWPVLSLGKTISLCPASFHTPRPNLPVTPDVSWLPTFAFPSPIIYITRTQGTIHTGPLHPTVKGNWDSASPNGNLARWWPRWTRFYRRLKGIPTKNFGRDEATSKGNQAEVLLPWKAISFSLGWPSGKPFPFLLRDSSQLDTTGSG